VSQMERVVAGEPLVELDYAAAVHADDLEPARTCSGSRPLRLLVAATVGPVRLIDNLDPHNCAAVPSPAAAC
jgi:pantothenate synthetase